MCSVQSMFEKLTGGWGGVISAETVSLCDVKIIFQSWANWGYEKFSQFLEFEMVGEDRM